MEKRYNLPSFYSLFFLSFFLLGMTFPAFSQVLTQSTTTPFSVTESTGKKPQSKVWKHADKWYCVMPNSSGTYIWRLDGTSWTQMKKLSNDSDFHADVKSVVDTVHILLFDDLANDVTLASVEFDAATQTYIDWSERASVWKKSLSGGTDDKVQSPNFDIDSKNRMWMAYKHHSAIHVRHSLHPYTSWETETVLDIDVDDPDIACVVAFTDNGGAKIGVMHSDQDEERFGFYYHLDTDPVATWSANENPGAASAQNVGKGFADDHINIAVASNGTLYAAVKTSYDTDGYVTMGLLVRRPNGIWDPFYEIDEKGTKPIAVLNESMGLLLYAYTYPKKEEKVVYRTIPINDLANPSARSFMINVTGHGSVSSTKDLWTDRVVVLAYNSVDEEVAATNMIDPATAFPVELMAFDVKKAKQAVDLTWATATEKNSAYFEVERATEANTFVTMGKISAAGNADEVVSYDWIDPKPQIGRNYYRLKMVDLDGTFSYSSSKAIEIGLNSTITPLIISPNPGREKAVIDLPQSIPAISGYLRVFDLMGKLVHQQNIADQPLPYVIEIDSHYPRGIYMIKLLHNGKTYSGRWMKQ